MSAERPKVVHVTSAHSPLDNRIFVKECRSLAAAGFEVILVAPDDANGAVLDGVRIRAVPKPAGRLERFLRTTVAAARAAWAERGDLYHFHDPDLTPWMLALRLGTGRPVVYDVHEDYRTGLAAKAYLPAPARFLASRLYGGLEAVLSRVFAVVVAERYYARRFPTATLVLNYPDAARFALSGGRESAGPPGTGIRLLYTGTVSEQRGALVMADLLSRLPAATLKVAGHCPPALASAMRARAGRPGALDIEGEGRHVPFERILELYAEPWTAGLALFPDSPHVREKELTKFFEYMAAGLPIVASRFPAWRELVEGTGAGICVDPADPEAIAGAIAALAADPERARRMGEAGRSAVRERFSWASQARNLEALYAQLLTRAPLGRGRTESAGDGAPCATAPRARAGALE